MRMVLVLLCFGCALSRVAAGVESLDDPTRPSGARGAAESRPTTPHDLQLEGIVHRDTGPIAIVDGRIVHEGDRIGDAQIEQISAVAVRYWRGGHDHTARLAQTTLQVRQPSAPQKELP